MDTISSDVRPLVGEPPRASLAWALRRPRIAGLDFLRAVAVLLVLADHSGIGQSSWLGISADGGLGVEIFFVISGFLITWLLLGEHETQGHINLARFYRRRLARLMPAMLGYMAFGLVVLLLTGKPVPWAAVASTALYVVNYYQAFTGAEAHYLSHCWSLAVEEQFYLVWPLLLAWLLRHGWPLARALTQSIIGLWVLKALLIVGLGASDEYVYRALETRADQLAIGCLLAVLLRSPGGQRWFERLARQPWAVPAAVLGVLLSSVWLRGSMVDKYLLGYLVEPLLVGLVLPLVILAARGHGWTARLLNASPMVLIGEISYGVYLFHPFVMHPVRHLAERLTGSTEVSVTLSILAVVGVAYLSFRFFEQPVRARLRGSP